MHSRFAMTTVAMVFGLAANLVGAAQAEVVLTSQTREVSPFASISQPDGGQPLFDSNEIQSLDPGGFSEEVMSHTETGGSHADGFAQQVSLIDPEIIEAAGDFWAEAVVEGEIQFAEELGASGPDLVYHVDEPTPYVLSGVLEGSGGGRASVRLLRINRGVLVYQTAENGILPIKEQGILEPGLRVSPGVYFVRAGGRTGGITVLR